MDGVTVLTRIERTDSRTSRVNGTTRTSTGSGTNPLLPSNLMRVRACRAHRHTIDSGARMGMGMVGVTRMLPLQHPNGSSDAFPSNPAQWNDSDGDGYGDNYPPNSA